MASEVHSARNTTGQMAEVPIDEVVPSALNPRQRFPEEGLRELAESIREHGIIEPIVVRPKTWAHESQSADILVAVRERWEIIAGERRWRAARLAGLRTVPVVIRGDVEHNDALKLMLTENLQRQDLNPLEEAEGYRRLAQLGMKQREIAESVKRSQPAVANSLRLLDLPQDVQERIRKGELSAAHGVALASYKGFPRLASHLAKLAAARGWTSRHLESALEDEAWHLESAGLLRTIGYGTAFAQAACQHCPHDARRNLRRGIQVCLKPECYTELQQKAEAEKQAEVERMLREAESRGQTLVDTGELKGDYRWLLNDPPPGCDPGCKRRAPAKDYRGEISDVCLDTSCYGRLRAAAAKAEKKAKLQTCRELQAQVRARVDALQEIGPRELALIGIEAMLGGMPSIIRATWARHTGVDQGDVPDFRTYSAARKQWQALAELEPLQIVKIALECRLMEELHRTYEQGYGGGAPQTSWYLGLQAERPANGGAAATTAVAAMAESPATPAGYFEPPEAGLIENADADADADAEACQHEAQMASAAAEFERVALEGDDG